LCEAAVDQLLDEGCELATERTGVLFAQIDLIVGTVDPKPHRLIRRAAVKIVFERDGDLLCHLGLPDRLGYQHRTRSTAMA